MNKMDAAREVVRAKLSETEKLKDDVDNVRESLYEVLKEQRDFRTKLLSEFATIRNGLFQNSNELTEIRSLARAAVKKDFWLKWIVIMAAFLLLVTMLLECIVIMCFMKS